MATDAIPWDREFPGNAALQRGLSCLTGCRRSWSRRTLTNVYINSLEPRWFFGSKGFAETCIGAPPGALANAIYNACGVRVREHPITKDKIMAGLKSQRERNGDRMKPYSVYRPTSVEEAIQILSLHGTESGVYAGGTDLLIQLKNRIPAAPKYLVDIKKIDGLRYIKEDGQGGVQIGALTKLAEVPNRRWWRRSIRC